MEPSPLQTVSPLPREEITSAKEKNFAPGVRHTPHPRSTEAIRVTWHREAWVKRGRTVRVPSSWGGRSVVCPCRHHREALQAPRPCPCLRNCPTLRFLPCGPREGAGISLVRKTELVAPSPLVCRLCTGLLIFHFQIWQVSLGRDGSCLWSRLGVGWERAAEPIRGGPGLLSSPPLPFAFLLFLAAPPSLPSSPASSCFCPAPPFPEGSRGLHGLTHVRQPSTCPL